MYYGSVTFFIHTHIVRGVAIVHSHPFSSSKNNHHHTNDGFIIIHLLSHFVALALAITFSAGILKILLETIRFSASHFFIVFDFVNINGLRAPPLK